MKIGDIVPSFSLADEEGNPVHIHDNMEQPLVIYFYPKDETPGCIREACAFRDSYEEFTDAGVKVFGISADSPESHKAFKEKYRLPFTLLSDEDNAVRKEFEVPGGMFGLVPGRVTYVADRTGTIKHIFNSQTQAERHIREALKAVDTF